MEGDTFDWRDYEVLNPIQHQKSGKCCFAFVVCAAIEAVHHKRGRKRILLSPQDLYNNLVKDKSTNDDGVTYPETLNWIMENGCVLEETCPYTGIYEAPGDRQGVVLKVQTSKPVPLIEMEWYVRREGPVMVEVDWIDEMDKLGKEDVIYRGPIDASAFDIFETHGVLIVGFGPDYWLVRNSHGIEWGNNGYAKFTREMVHGRFLINNGWIPKGISYVNNEIYGDDDDDDDADDEEDENGEDEDDEDDDDDEEEDENGEDEDDEDDEDDDDDDEEEDENDEDDDGEDEEDEIDEDD